MPWVFMSLMLANAAYLGWVFVTKTDAVSEMPSHAQAELVGHGVVLLSERAMQEPITVDAAEPPDSIEPESETSLANCFNVGPFGAEPAATGFAARMASKGYGVGIERRRVNERDYWVFVPPFTNQKKAEEKLKDLRGRGIKGFVVKDGIFANSISLNHFSQRDLAQAFLEKMRAEGVAAEYREINRADSAFWVRLAPGGEGTALRNDIDSYVNDKADLRRELIPCEE